MDVSKSREERYAFSESLSVTLDALRKLTGGTSDLVTSEAELGGVRCAVAVIEGMASTQMLSSAVLEPIMLAVGGSEQTPQGLFELITKRTLLTPDRKLPRDLPEAASLLFAGFCVLFAEGVAGAAAFGVQGFDRKAVNEPSSEHNIMGSQEGFCETLRTNISLVRRRMKNPALRFEALTVGRETRTDIALCYLAGRAESGLVRKLRRRLSDVGMDAVLASGTLMPYLEEKEQVGLFSEVSATERPDVVCAKLNEGRAAVLIDGTPFALVCPSLFVENFRTVDDACSKPYFVILMRLIRFIAFFFAVLFPGAYVAVANYHPEMLTLKLLLNLTASERSTPYSLFVEMLIITVLLELMKEASVRMPKAVGSAISIAGGLVIGDAAVKSGIISSPLLIIVGLTATASFVIPGLAQQSSVLRLVYIIAGGTAGFFGIAVVSGMIMTNAASMNEYGIPYTAPLLPFTRKGAADILGRKSLRRLEEEHSTVADYREAADE